MTEPASPPRLLPGWTALRWRRVLTAGLLAGVVLVLLVLVIDYVSKPSEWRLVPAVPLLAVPGFVLIVVFGIPLTTGNTPKEKQEVAAGYTTIPGRYPNVMQLDPKTGDVVRPAGEVPRQWGEAEGSVPAPLAAIAPSLVPRASGPSEDFPLTAPSRFLVRVVPIVVGAVVFVVVSRIPLQVVVFVAILVGASAGLTVLVRRGRKRRLVAGRSGVRAEFALPLDDLSQAALRLGGLRFGKGAAGIVFTDDGLEFWRTGPELALAVPWESVIDAKPGSVTYRQKAVRAIVLSIEMDAGRAILPLAITTVTEIPATARRLNGLLALIRSRMRDPRLD